MHFKCRFFTITRKFTEFSAPTFTQVGESNSKSNSVLGRPTIYSLPHAAGAGSVAGNQIVDLRGSARSVTKDKPSEAFKNFDKSSSSEGAGAAVVSQSQGQGNHFPCVVGLL